MSKLNSRFEVTKLSFILKELDVSETGALSFIRWNIGKTLTMMFQLKESVSEPFYLTLST
jgi:hypothetical protein